MVSRPDSTAAVARLLGHDFADPTLLEQALTHPSAGGPSRAHYQRLEFLGDRVLGLIVAEALMETFPDLPEGELAPRFNQLVRRETLAEVAEEIGLGKHLRLGPSEAHGGGRHKAAILSDAVEAVIGALHLEDPGAARRFVLAQWRGRVRDVARITADAKSRLQEWAQGRGMARPDYRVVARSGPDHAPMFRVAVRLENGAGAEGEARSKRLAEQDAAARLLTKVADDE